MKNPFRPEAALGFVTLLVCLPIAATLLYLFGHSVSEFVANPLKYPVLLALTVGYAIGLMLTGIRAFLRRHDARGAQ